MIIVLPTTKGVLVGLELGALINHRASKTFQITRDDLHRFQAMQRYLSQSVKTFNKRDIEN